MTPYAHLIDKKHVSFGQDLNFRSCLVITFPCGGVTTCKHQTEFRLYFSSTFLGLSGPAMKMLELFFSPEGLDTETNQDLITKHIITSKWYACVSVILSFGGGILRGLLEHLEGAVGCMSAVC